MSKKRKNRKNKKFKNVIEPQKFTYSELAENNFKNVKEWQEKFLANVKVSYQKMIATLKKWNNIFCTRMTCKTNIKRDANIILVVILIAVIFLGLDRYVSFFKSKFQDRQNEIGMLPIEELVSEADREAINNQFEELNVRKIETIQEKIDTSAWKDYQSNWYGFKIKYPQDWKAPVVQPNSKISSAVYRVFFATNNQENKNFRGFDVAIYDIAKTKEFFQTDEFPELKDASLKDAESCKNIEGHMIETGDYPAEEIYIPQGDDCYDSVLFFSVVNGQYIYNMVPRLKDDAVMNGDLTVAVSDNLPEFFEVVSSFENINIVRPKPKPVAPKITAPMPVSYKVVGGRLVCANKNDKPSKSDKGKGRHLDMECCLDPDEYPNPHCYYDVAKYGKYLK